jgi:hypothetical protein
MSEETTIVEVLEDGTIYAFDLDVCDQEASNVLETLHEKEGNLFNFDFGATVFSLFVYCIHILRSSGWSTDNLIDEALSHCESYDDEEDDEEDDE